MSQKKQKQVTNQKNKRISEIIQILLKYKVALGVNPTKIREIIEELGPTYVKLGQILSMRSDLIPKEYADELKKLQSSVKPMEYAEVEKILQEEFDGKRMEDIFLSFDPIPLGSASIAQAHKAVLKDTKETVVVKIQRSNIYETMKQDMELLNMAIDTIQFIHPNQTASSFEILIKEMWMTAQEEMDFQVEKDHIEKITKNQENIKYIAFPKVYDSYTTKKVLTMEYIEGISISNKEALLENEYDLKEIGVKLCENYVKQILDDNFFHADPHMGNILIRDGKIVWIDLGMVGSLSPRDLSCVGNIVKGVMEYDIPTIKDNFLAMGFTDESIDQIALSNDINALVNKYATMSMKAMDFTVLIGDGIALMKKYKITIPDGVSMFARGILTIQGVVKTLDPDINLMQIISNHLTNQRLSKENIEHEIKEMSHNLYASSKKMIQLPSAMTDFLKETNKGNTKIKVENTFEKNTNNMFESITNRICATFIIGCGLLGSSLLCTTQLKPIVIGIPLIGLLGFALSFIMGIILLCKTFHYGVFINKLKKKKKDKKNKSLF